MANMVHVEDTISVDPDRFVFATLTAGVDLARR